ncbi:hypothetical protein AB0F18_13110 [Streptomyces sp. NPDC029216]|uniref:hypothetical protein n=1 Tax=Streptomyces sp. NPDC029216 TaxID=3154701 RepID=UPI0033EAF46C
MGEQGEAFEELAYALVQALDDWRDCLQEVMAGPGPSRSGLLARLRDADPKIDNPLLGHWLLGRNQLLGENKRSSRVPTVQDTARIVAAFRDDAAPQRRRLMEIARRIEFNRTQLHKIKGHQWRSAVVNALKAPERPGPVGPADPAGALAPVPGDEIPPQVPAAAGSTTARAFPGEGGERAAADPTAQPAAAAHPAPAASGSWKRPAVVMGAVGVVIALVVAAHGWSRSDEEGGRAEPSSSSAASVAGTNAAQSRDALGGDSRCSPPRSGPSGVQLRACTRVQRDKVAFALKVDNPTASAAEVTVKVGGFWAGATHDCKPGPGTTRVTVEPGTTFTTEPAHCETARQDAPLAYQAEAYIAAGDGQEWTGHVFSPRANVYADRGTLWRCGGDVPC